LQTQHTQKKKFGIPLFADDRMPMTGIYMCIILMSICANTTFAGKKLYIYILFTHALACARARTHTHTHTHTHTQTGCLETHIPSTNNTMKMSYGKMPFNVPVLSKTFLNFRNVATSGLVTVHKYALSVPRMQTAYVCCSIKVKLLFVKHASRVRFPHTLLFSFVSYLLTDRNSFQLLITLLLI
jgi:hypothetical protein